MKRFAIVTKNIKTFRRLKESKYKHKTCEYDWGTSFAVSFKTPQKFRLKQWKTAINKI